MKKLAAILSLALICTKAYPQNKMLNSFANAGSSIFYNLPGATTPRHIGVIGQPLMHQHGGTLVVSSLMYATDLHPPVITYDPTSLTIHLGQEPSINFLATDNDQIVSSKVFYRPMGKVGDFQSAPASTGANNSFTKSVSTPWYDEMGMEYYIEVRDKENTTRHPSGAGKHVAFAIHSAPQIPTNLLSYGRTKNNYRIISIPFLTNSPITQIFEELGPSNKKKYRIYKYENNAFKEYPAFTTVSQGDGYFIIMSDLLSNVVLSMPEFQAPPNNQSELYELSLKPGWNLIGNPYTLEINWDDILHFNEDPVSVGSNLKIWTEAGNYTNVKNLAAYQGAFVFVNGTEPITLQVPFKGQVREISGGRKGQDRKYDSWQVNLTLSSSEEKNCTAAFGMHEQAMESFDALDDLDPPSIQEFLTIKFIHPEHPEKFFVRDINPFREKHEWEFDVTPSNNKERKLSWSLSETSQVLSDLYLYDVHANAVINMKTSSAYSFPANAQRFKILFGQHGLEEIYPDQVTVLPPYPNPISPMQRVVFSIGIPNAQTPYPVALHLYDALGKDIFQTTRSLSTGLHTIALPTQPELGVQPGELLYYQVNVGKSVYSGKIIYKP